MSRSAAIDDPAWVLARYKEAKALLSELREDLNADEDFAGGVTDEFRNQLEDFHEVTFLDTCTTLGRDCGCNWQGDCEHGYLRAGGTADCPACQQSGATDVSGFANAVGAGPGGKGIHSK